MRHVVVLGRLGILSASLLSVALAQASPPVPQRPTEASAPQDSDEDETGASDDSKHRAPNLQGWYGYQILIGDAAAVGMFALGSEKSSRDWLALSTGTYFLSAPVIHVLHGNSGRALGSLGLRLGAVLLGTALYVGQEGCFTDSEYHGPPCTITPLYVSTIIAGILDATALAWETPSGSQIAPSPKPATNSQPFSPRMSPTLATLPGGAYLGVAGSF
jgi:hypothetical protein